MPQAVHMDEGAAACARTGRNNVVIGILVIEKANSAHTLSQLRLTLGLALPFDVGLLGKLKKLIGLFGRLKKLIDDSDLENGGTDFDDVAGLEHHVIEGATFQMEEGNTIDIAFRDRQILGLQDDVETRHFEMVLWHYFAKEVVIGVHSLLELGLGVAVLMQNFDIFI